MGSKKGGRTAFSIVVEPREVRVRKRLAPAGRPLPAARDKKPRHRPDYLVETE